MKTRKIEGAHGEYLLVEWAAPKEPNLINLGKSGFVGGTWTVLRQQTQQQPRAYSFRSFVDSSSFFFSGEFGDQSTQLDLNSFDQYQVFWASDSQTFFDFLEPNDEGWGYKLIPNGAVRHEFLEKEPGFCYWPHFNTSNMTSLQSMAPSPSAMEDYMETLTPSSANAYADYINDEFGPNASYPIPPNTDCIMDTECGIQNNGVPAYIKVKRNWETDVKGLGLVREICTAVMDDASGLEVEECVRNPTADAPVRKPDPKAKEFVRYEMQVNRHGEGGDEGVECGRTTYVMPGLKDPKTNTWIGKYNRSNGFKCTKGKWWLEWWLEICEWWSWLEWWLEICEWFSNLCCCGVFFPRFFQTGMPLTRVSVNGHVNANYCDRGLSEITRRCKPGLQCTYKLLDEKYRCEKTYLRPDTAVPEETDLFIRTRVPHDCWKTGDDYCKKGTKIIDVPPVERRVPIKIINNKYTERWQPWDKTWVKTYMDAPNSKECRSVLFKQADHHPGVTHSHQHFVGCTWDLKPGQIINEQYERDIGDYSIWKRKCGDPCRVDFSFLNAPLRMRVPSIEMTFDGSQSTRFGLDGIIHASLHEVNGLNNQKEMAKERQKLYASLEEAFTAVFTAHGIASAVDAVSDSDVLVLQSRCDLELTTPTDSISAEKNVYTIPMGPMPCSEPFVCTFMHWRSREVKVNVVRKKCVKIMKHPMLGYKCKWWVVGGCGCTVFSLFCFFFFLCHWLHSCTAFLCCVPGAQFQQLKEMYSGTKGNTTYDQESQGASDNTIMWIGMAVGFVLAILVSIIMFMKVRTSMRLNQAYDHVDKHLAGQPATIDRRRSEHHLKERAKAESGQEKQKQLWDKKSKMIKQNIQKKKDEFKRRMKAIKKENQRRERDLRDKIEFEALERAKLNKRRAKIREHRAEIAKKKAEQEYNKLLASHHNVGHKK